MRSNLPSNIRDPMCFSYFGDIKLAYIEFNEYNANESFMEEMRMCDVNTLEEMRRSLYGTKNK